MTVIGRAAAMAWLKASITLPTTMTVARVTEKLMIRAAEASETGDQPPRGVVRRQDGVDQGAHEGDEGEPAQEGRHHLLQARRDDVGGVEGDPDDPASGDGRAPLRGAERRARPAGGCGGTDR